MVGSAFLWALKAVAPFLVLFVVISAIARSGAGLGSRFKRVVTLYLVSTIIAAVVAVVYSFLFPVHLTFTGDSYTEPYSGNIAELVTLIVSKIICNPVSALAEGNYLGILFWAIIIGLFVRKLASDTTTNLCNDASNILMAVIKVSSTSHHSV